MKILLPIVIIIWGIVIYKIVDAFNPDEISKVNKVESTFKIPEIQSKETFELLPVDRDPFLGTINNRSKIKSIQKNSTKKSDNVVWPTITYLGIVSDKNAKTSVYILQINGQQHLLKKGEIIHEIQLLGGSEETVRLRFQRSTKEFSIM